MLLHLEKGSIRSDLSKGAGEGGKEADREPWPKEQQTINRESFLSRMVYPLASLTKRR